MNKINKALFIFGFVFYFIGDLATTYIALGNGMAESGLIRIITRYDFSIMVLMKVIFYTALYFFIEYLEKRDNYLCGAVLGACCGNGYDDNLVKCSDNLGDFEVIGAVS